ncbi:hypothetical protein WICPIJ_005113 [Wickerhamomyces pijperi]|uniref:Uncharacterized protein n=1 Tax=Wickerhamomyces pijperi TaxID=599730 RepID=A0A9P8TLF2_WICPI|nr:hypothetical protein WICPIJ_005113 [Wickerhamomyces pijperi]
MAKFNSVPAMNDFMKIGSLSNTVLNPPVPDLNWIFKFGVSDTSNICLNATSIRKLDFPNPAISVSGIWAMSHRSGG